MNAQPDLIDVRFEQMARRYGERVALVGAHQTLTYRQLSALSDRFARVLTDLGVAPHMPVALSVGRSPEAIVAMLAILKAGAHYVPIDPAYPAQARAAYLTKVGARFIVLPPDGAAPVAGAVGIPLSLAALALQSAPAAPAATAAHGRQRAAYVMFTSGSTGEPKAALIAHSGVLRLVLGTNYIALTERDVLFALSPITFDASTFEIWGALLNGARLVLYEPAVFDLNAVADLVAQHAVTVLWLTAALFHLVVRRAPHLLAGLRTLLAGGDIVQPDAVRAVFQAYPHLVLVNGYGPTENTTFTCCYVMTAATALGAAIPIGYPVTGTSVLVLDEHQRALPAGAVGELYAGGLGVALGYVNAAQQSARAFIADPLTPGARLYKTGDLVRRDADGLCHFVGRIDNQVKIRGYRVSVEEVQQAISAIAGVEESVVQVQDDAAGGRRLAAFVQTSGEPAAFRLFLKGELARTLPAFMVPDLLDIQQALPVNGNGKLDRSRLAAGAAHSATTK